MKRSVAIRGPTPMFVRWAIQRQCPLREIHAERLPETTFRQLRAIRELSLGQQQGRTHTGYCLHPHNRVDAPEEALGFSVDEVVDLFGGIQSVDESCRGCPANAGAELDENFLAGCFGIVSADLRWNLDKILRGEFVADSDHSVFPSNLSDVERSEFPSEAAKIHAFDLPQIVNKNFAEPHLGDARTQSGSELPIWVRLWQERVPSSAQLLLLEQTFEKAHEFLNSNFPRAVGVHASACSAPSRAVEDHASACSAPLKPLASSPASATRSDTVLDPSMTQDLRQFLHAIRRCRKFELPLHVELIPAGHSDGQTWRLHPHCQNCKQTWQNPSQPCSICGPRGSYQNEIKLKVLGLRPYLRLADMIGLDETLRLLTGLRNF